MPHEEERRGFITSIKQPGICDYIAIMRQRPSADYLIRLCISGDLRTSSVRAIVWRMLLKALPLAKDEWSEVLCRSRANYDGLRARHINDPHFIDAASLDPTVHNPLSDAENSTWRKFFEDGEIRDLIGKDVMRCFPEMEFFQMTKIKNILSTILLVYAKDHPYIMYKQGMHELLAPLVFVLYSDQQTYEHYKETEALIPLSSDERNVLCEVYNEDFLEHDSYTLFMELMREVSDWYQDGCSPMVERTPSPFPQPFMRMQDAPATSLLMNELARIGKRLAEVDECLHTHLCSLDIPPQLYGIRWLRLLFGREFPLHDLLFVWDVLFSQQPLVSIVECFFIAMLLHIKPLLLCSDYSGCLQYLMRFPPISDVVEFSKLVLHLRYPKRYSRPQKSSESLSFPHLTVGGTIHPNRFSNGGPPIVLAESTKEDEMQSRPSTPSKAGKNSIFGKARRKERPSSHVGNSLNSDTHSAPTIKGRRSVEEQLAILTEEMRENDARMTEAAKTLQRFSDQLLLPAAEQQVFRDNLSIQLADLAHSLAASCSFGKAANSSPVLRELEELRPGSSAIKGRTREGQRSVAPPRPESSAVGRGSLASSVPDRGCPPRLRSRAPSCPKLSLAPRF